MTITEPKSRDEVLDTELLFQEARQRRKHRWLVSGIVTLVLLVVLGVTFGLALARGSARPTGPAAVPPLAGVGHSAATLNFRPVLCFAPPLSVTSGRATSSGPLPACSSSSQLTAANLDVRSDSSGVAGYTANNVPADTQFDTYRSTSPFNDDKAATVILPSSPGSQSCGGGRCVLGPAQLTGSAVKSAAAQLEGGEWVVNVTLTGKGSTQWDTFTQRQFHQIIAVDLDGRVISAPIIQPTQSSFASFGGHLQISGGFTEQRAKAISAEL
jgi:hypothetical protein